MHTKPAKRTSIMLIDDNDTDNFVHRRIIEISDCSDNIIIHNSGTSALEYLDLHKENILQLPDLIFLDLNMPVMDGFTFLSELGNLPGIIKNKCKIVILSSSHSKPDIEKALGNNYVIDYIPKPLSSEILKKIINKININDLITD